MTRVLVTGAAGSIGVPLVEKLRADRTVVYPTDLPGEYNGTDQALDVRDKKQVHLVLSSMRPTVIFHLAGAKHAPEGELDPAGAARTNIDGTANVLRYAGDAKVVLASTCKACDPETAYGASKLIAERMVLNAGGVVVRYYNVRETAGNVFRLWESLPLSQPIPWTDCYRYFISLDEAVALTVRAAGLPSGRYTVDPGSFVHMHDEAARLYPNRPLVEIPRRRGDRHREPLCATSERLLPYEGLMWVESPHDPEYEQAAA